MTHTHEQIRALCDAATDGEWHVTKKKSRVVCNSIGKQVAKCPLITKGFNGSDIPEQEAEANARFIAASRQIIPQLLDEVERLEGALEAIAMQENNQSVIRIKQIAQQALGQKT